VESLNEFRRSRRVIEDFTSRTLAAISGDFAKLCYVGSLREPATGRYRHDGLIEIYSDDAVQRTLSHCHAELFARILETPLSEQESDLRDCLSFAGDAFWQMVGTWRAKGPLPAICPDGMPGYLSDLFLSNLQALMEVCSGEPAIAAPAA